MINYRVFVTANGAREFVGKFPADDGQDAIRQAERVYLAPETAIWTAEPEPVKLGDGK